MLSKNFEKEGIIADSLLLTKETRKDIRRLLTLDKKETKKDIRRLLVSCKLKRIFADSICADNRK